eukprot:TRINITY_DN6537_c0_g1_i2.p1 TRINITY_DN6537_c0_g1~~TRINITY_DN6537_c0_g1_i2.p1  ORF type:complete len:464 (-),score=97.68 TRINITY_DN6537_c0_g1_i2:147-1538(-)
MSNGQPPPVNRASKSTFDPTPPPRPSSGPPDRTGTPPTTAAPAPPTAGTTSGGFVSGLFSMLGSVDWKAAREHVAKAATQVHRELTMAPLVAENATYERQRAIYGAVKAAYMSLAIYRRGLQAAESLSKLHSGQLLLSILQEESPLATNFLVTTATAELLSSDYTDLLTFFRNTTVATIDTIDSVSNDSATFASSSTSKADAQSIVGSDAGSIARRASDKTLYVIFRGSSSLRDWFVNFSAVPVNFKGNVNVHVGMHVSLNAYYAQIRDLLISFLTKNPDFQLVVTGHSLGGGYATLLYLYLSVDPQMAPYVSKMTLYTFGAPAVLHCNPEVSEDQFLAELRQYINVESMHMFVHSTDIVPRLLGTNLTEKLCGLVGIKLGENQHVERMKYFRHAGNYYLLKDDIINSRPSIYPCDKPSIACDIPPTVFAHIYAKGANVVVSDHAMHLYLEKLQTSYSNLLRS